MNVCERQSVALTTSNLQDLVDGDRRQRVGIEVELLMPGGLTRKDLAIEVAKRSNGSVRNDWHLDSEPSNNQDLRVFQHLTPRFVVNDQDNNPIVAFVNDVTITADLTSRPSSENGWIKVLSDDARLLRSLQKLIPSDAQDVESIENAIDSVGLHCQKTPRAVRITDSNNSPIALVTEITDDSARVAECISPPITHNLHHWLELVIGTAADLGASVPAEGATHLHYDAPQFASPEIFRRMVWAFGDSHRHLRTLFNTNSECRRLGPLPYELVEFVGRPHYDTMSWREIKTACQSMGTITKFTDVNLTNLIQTSPILNTVEFRMLPASIDTNKISTMIQMTDELVEQLITGNANPRIPQ